MSGAGCRLSGAGCTLSGAGCGLSRCRLQVAGCGLQGVGCGLQVAGCRLQVRHVSASEKNERSASSNLPPCRCRVHSGCSRTYACTHTSILHVHASIRMCMHPYACAYIHTHVHASRYVYVRVRATDVHVHVHVHVHAHAHVHAHVRACARMRHGTRRPPVKSPPPRTTSTQPQHSTGRSQPSELMCDGSDT